MAIEIFFIRLLEILALLTFFGFCMLLGAALTVFKCLFAIIELIVAPMLFLISFSIDRSVDMVSWCFGQTATGLGDYFNLMMH